jgi:SARP family transcriptional regulator, regulator of embCAB operon
MTQFYQISKQMYGLYAKSKSIRGGRLSMRSRLRDDLDPASDVLVADLREQGGVIGPHVLADFGQDLPVGCRPRDVTAFALDLPVHGYPLHLVAGRFARLSSALVGPTTIQLCGPYVVELDGRRVEQALPGRQGRLLFAYLVLNRDRPLGRAELIEAVWSQEPPRDPADALAALLSKVRAALGNGYLEGRTRLSLVLPSQAEVDVERALSAVHQAESACSQRDWPRAWGAALSAQIVANRTLLGEYEGEWIEAWRQRLDEVLVRALECYASACLGLGRTELAGAERAARLVVRMAPLHESGYGLLMAALEAQGNVAEALVVYEALRQRLRAELGVSPAEALQTAYMRLLGASGGA